MSQTAPTTRPQVSVVIPTLNAPTLAETLAALRGQRYDLSRVEVLVVGVAAPDVVQADGLVRYIDTGGPVSAARARNVGLAEARGEIICFTDDDCRPAPDWLEKLLAAYQTGDRGVVGGGMSLPRRGYWAQCDAMTSAYEQLNFQPAGPRRQLPSLNFSMRRALLAQFNGFSESFPKAAGEDSHLSARLRQAGHTLWFTPEAVVDHLGWRKSGPAVLGHAHLFGQHSVWIQPDMERFVKPPFFFRHWLLMLLITPLLAGWITGRMYLRQRRMCRYWVLLPGIYLAQVAWGLGVTRTLWRRKTPSPVQPNPVHPETSDK
ncbi:MAG: glycosyltransferase [Anaerolineae bacterium]|nr:glycosyltransferase [Anaerolineae bacterium]